MTQTQDLDPNGYGPEYLIPGLYFAPGDIKQEFRAGKNDTVVQLSVFLSAPGTFLYGKIDSKEDKPFAFGTAVPLYIDDHAIRIYAGLSEKIAMKLQEEIDRQFLTAMDNHERNPFSIKERKGIVNAAGRSTAGIMSNLDDALVTQRALQYGLQELLGEGGGDRVLHRVVDKNYLGGYAWKPFNPKTLVL